MADLQSGPARALTQAERFVWGTCPTCEATHGEACHADVGVQVGVPAHGGRMRDGDGVHVSRLQRAPDRVREVPA